MSIAGVVGASLLRPALDTIPSRLERGRQLLDPLAQGPELRLQSSQALLLVADLSERAIALFQVLRRQTYPHLAFRQEGCCHSHFQQELLNRWRGGVDDSLREFRSLAPKRLNVLVLIGAALCRLDLLQTGRHNCIFVAAAPDRAMVCNRSHPPFSSVA